jgi:hypothetical protein
VPDVQKFRRGLLTVSEFQLARLTLPLASVPFDSASKFMARRGKYASKITAKPLKYRKFPIFHLTRCLTIQGYFEINLVRVRRLLCPQFFCWQPFFAQRSSIAVKILDARAGVRKL